MWLLKGKEKRKRRELFWDFTAFYQQLSSTCSYPLAFHLFLWFFCLCCKVAPFVVFVRKDNYEQEQCRNEPHIGVNILTTQILFVYLNKQPDKQTSGMIHTLVFIVQSAINGKGRCKGVPIVENQGYSLHRIKNQVMTGTGLCMKNH